MQGDVAMVEILNTHAHEHIHTQGDVAMVEILKENGANVDAQTKMSDSCLHLAVTRCDVQMISKLIAMGVLYCFRIHFFFFIFCVCVRERERVGGRVG